MQISWFRRHARALASRRVVIVCAIVLASSLVVSSTAAFGFDRSISGTLLPDTRIGGVAVGGLGMAEAIELLRQRYEDPLHLPVRVVAPSVNATMTPWDLGLRVDVDRSARSVLQRERDGGLFRRIWRRLFGSGERTFALAPSFDAELTKSFLRDAAARAFVPSADAAMESSDGWIHVRPGRVGRELDMDAAEHDLLAAARGHADRVELRTKPVQPNVPSSAFASVVLVRAGENKLYLYENGVITKTYSVATGSTAFPTPFGTFRIVAKRKNPTWVNPGSDWAKRMPGAIPPGPDNPLGSRAMDLNVEGIRIHGTPDAGSIGYSVSHGCVRMNMADAEDLFSHVSVGTPVVIFDAGPPKARPKATPAPAAPAAPAPSSG